VRIDNSPARGNQDLLPATVAVRDHVLKSIADVYRTFGYQRIETPAIENIERLQGGQGGENEKLIFEILRRGLPSEIDKGTRVRDLVDLGLRYDLTVPLTRFYGNNQASLPSPFRSLQIGPVWRAERPQKGRYRQFYQCDIDIIGEPSVLAEVELIEATSQALNAIGLDGIKVRLSDRRILTALAAGAGVPESAQDSFFITLDKLDKIGWEGVTAEFQKIGLSDESVMGVVDNIGALGELAVEKLPTGLADALPGLQPDVIDDFSTTAECLNQVTSERMLNWQFDPTLVRGMGYYTGQIFEMSHERMPGSVAGGGRYDRLIGRSLGRDVPACGFSIGFERIVDLLESGGRRDAVALLADNEIPVPDILTAARRLRSGGRAVETVRGSGKFGAQLSRLEKAGFSSFIQLRMENGRVVLADERALKSNAVPDPE
jgi:histidyl-tRNA synthetase